LLFDVAFDNNRARYFSPVDAFFTENQFDWGRVLECCIEVLHR